MPPGAAALISLPEGFYSFEQGRNILRRTNVFESHGQEFVPGKAVLAHRSVVHREKAQSLPVKDPGRMRIVVKQLAVPLFALPQQRFSPPTLSNVAGDLRKSTEFASPVRQRSNNYVGPKS